MKKVIGCLFTILLSILLISCSGNIEKNEEVNYTVVKISNDAKVDDLFKFESISQIAVDSELSKLNVENGCYCIGTLKDGNCIIWKSNNNGYDDLFIYVEDKVSNTQIVKYAVKLKETPISYDSFKQKINDKRKDLQ